ncbi:hypothetical protein DAPPUDRAFT_105630 [Daphnia pulex]|uniref:HTH psq-type domain-containing protein n=1 Tax=Daphnia pulex TaxID=6669 RepID=E9GRB2_DAPPU|nr:hypothetical protein DAPPUDRAFT_105630 [Daphnia pulex]|eukprot:EFX77981.1 hypothetical protein DAPPUDRAFT_105630 [Daphnia pulex]
MSARARALKCFISSPCCACLIGFGLTQPIGETGASWYTGKRRNHVRRTYRVKAPSDVIERGVAMVLYDGKSCSRVAILFDIPRSLTRYAEKKKKSGLEEQNMPNSVFPTHHGYSSVRQVSKRKMRLC